MKSFSEKLNESVKPYEEKDIRSAIYSIIDAELGLSSVDESLSISGKQDLVERIVAKMYMDNLKETIDTYKEIYDNPSLLQECDVAKKKKVKVEKEGDDLEKDEKIEKQEDQDGVI